MGVEVIIEEYDYALKGSEQVLIKSMTEVLTLITAQAKLLCPVDFGQLGNSIMWKLGKTIAGFNDGSVSGSRGVTAKGALRKGDGGGKAPDQDMITIKASKFVGYVGTGSDHWWPEFGTRFSAAQPFLRPAKARIADGSSPENIARKYGRTEMVKAFNARKTTIKREKV